jgi:D-alanyl-D-alanine carboxypeptidase (penicillin-binding protein 5/6)
MVRVARAPLALFVAAFVVFAMVAGPPALARSGFSPRRFAAISVDAESGKVLYARNADARRYPASLTKVMTLYIAFDEIRAGKLSLDDEIVMSRHAAAQAPTKLGLPAGRRLKVRDAINIIVVQSANDLAVALAEKIAGSETAFARRMNAKARALGMTHTHFANASGLPNPHNVSTARDLSILARAFLRNHPAEYAVFDQDHAVFRGRVIHGHNRLLDRPGIDGIKTGYTRASGFNLMTSGERDGRRVVAVVLGGNTASVRDAFMRQLMRTSFAKVETSHAHRTEVAQVDDEARETETASAQTGRDGDEGDWWVQVGAFSTRDRAVARLAEVRKQHPDEFAEAAQDIDRPNALYQARFAADSEADARAGCAALQSAGESCIWFASSGAD